MILLPKYDTRGTFSMKRFLIPFLLFLWISLILVYFYKEKGRSRIPPKIIIGKQIIQSSQQKDIRVRRVIDGDTIELENGAKVRYIGINTPESVDPRRPMQCFGQEAKEENKKLVLGKIVKLEKDITETDKYGRLLRYVYVNSLFINDYLVKNGFAQVSTFPPDVKYQDQFRESQNEARTKDLGLWKNCKRK